ncbi:archaea-specific SMC-related protein [Salinigranum salinum]|uniref:archaea-specific SMC-related protein n=1 Tax=Salinigranum salinum TaxID=1364937 RepID=UPI00126091F1|nr:archaea-specific SMC-related protein [Salinigranum salinum]
MSWHLTIENIAGIHSGDVTIEPGVNAVRASNWQGKSSLLTAVETVMGTARDLTESEDHGCVRLDVGEETYEVELVREGRTVTTRGNPYLEDRATRTAASLFAFLGEDNAVRRAVRQGENLESVLTRPLDFENIDEQISELRAERSSVEAELERATEAASSLPEARSSVTTLEEELGALREERADLVERSGIGEDSSAEREELGNALAEQEDLESQIERLERSVERTQEKLTDSRESLEALSVPAPADDLASELQQARERYDRRKRDTELLQSVYAPTKRILDEDRLELITDVEHDLLDDTVRCWTCGEETDEATVEERLDALGERVTTLRSEADAAHERVETLEERIEDRRDAERRQADLEERIRDLQSTLGDRETSLERARERRDELERRIEELSDEVSAEDDRLTDVESELKYTRMRLEEAREELATLETRADQQETLEAEYERLAEEITRLRTRKQSLKRQTREAFEDELRALLDRFDTGFETARLTSAFELVVARNGREASLDALSEGEVELLGIVAALAGRDAFDTPDSVPIMLVDNLGGLTDANQQTLVSYLETRTEYLLVTAYPEHSVFEGHTVDTSNWSVVSPNTT